MKVFIAINTAIFFIAVIITALLGGKPLVYLVATTASYALLRNELNEERIDKLEKQINK